MGSMSVRIMGELFACEINQLAGVGLILDEEARLKTGPYVGRRLRQLRLALTWIVGRPTIPAYE